MRLGELACKDEDETTNDDEHEALIDIANLAFEREADNENENGDVTAASRRYYSEHGGKDNTEGSLARLERALKD